MTERIPLLIVGGGIGGLAAALALARQGRRVHLVEKEPEFGEIGAGLQLAPNASRALDRLGVLDEVRKHAVYPKRLMWMDAVSGQLVTALDLGGKFLERYGYPYLVMHRSDLLIALLEACRANPLIHLESGKDVVAVEDLGDVARARFADGSHTDCDALVGADGLWSTVRKFVHDDGDPICAEYVAYRGAIPIGDMAEHAGLDNVVIWSGPEIHLVQYPVRRAELYNQVAVFRSHRYQPDSDDWGTVAELDEQFGKTCAAVRTALTRIKRNRRWPMFDRVPIAEWTRNRIALLGDAAHPMLQYLAQGACQALEDAVCLADRLEQHGDDVARGLLAYRDARYLRTARVQLTARFFGEVLHVDGVGVTLRNALLAQRAHDDHYEIDWLYRYGA
jgi:2-polyprenyl-6-methoxyphenol hydroxylase-like FAD-dependent oxidoreductase